MAARRLDDRAGVRAARLRLTLAATLVGVVLVASAAAGTYVLQLRAMQNTIDDSVHQRADDVIADIRSDTLPRVITIGGDDQLSQVTDPGGRIVAASAILGDAPAIGADLPADGRIHSRSSFFRAERFRVLVRDVDTARGTFRVLTAFGLDDVRDAALALRRTFTRTIPPLLVALALVMWWIVGRTLRPVAQAARRQEQFVADAAHELRTPLARIRTELEVDRANPESTDWRATHDSVLEEMIGLEQLVGSLLTLAHLDAATEPAPPGPVDLDDIVLAESARSHATATVAVDGRGISAAQVLGDESELARVIRNLLDNACRHAQSTVQITLREDRGDAELVVADDGPGVPTEMATRIFERFGRADEARTADRGGAGLGLAIARDIVRRHHGTLELANPGEPGAQFVVRFPLADADQNHRVVRPEPRPGAVRQFP